MFPPLISLMKRNCSHSFIPTLRKCTMSSTFSEFESSKALLKSKPWMGFSWDLQSGFGYNEMLIACRRLAFLLHFSGSGITVVSLRQLRIPWNPTPTVTGDCLLHDYTAKLMNRKFNCIQSLVLRTLFFKTETYLGRVTKIVSVTLGM